MSEPPDNLVLVYVPWIDGKIDQLIEDVQDLKRCLTSLHQVASFRSEMAAMASQDGPRT
jgi:hypothetical protein